jgi:hypothetical protein
MIMFRVDRRPHLQLSSCRAAIGMKKSVCLLAPADSRDSGAIGNTIVAVALRYTRFAAD